MNHWKDLPVVFLGWVEFDGTDFSGFQIQPARRTVQGVLTETLASFLPLPFRLYGSSRTDAGVHARRMGISLHLPEEPPWPAETLLAAWQARLPGDLALHALLPRRPPFHARYSALSKRYRYRILRRPSPLRRRYAWWFHRTLDLSRMEKALRDLPSEADLSAFHAGPPLSDPRTSGFRMELLVEDDEVQVVVEARRFFHKSVRLLVGTLLQIGEGMLPPESLRQALQGIPVPIRPLAVPACGLTLEEVVYPPDVSPQSA